MNDVQIRSLHATDWPAVERIYREGIATGHATFEAEPPDWDGFNSSKHPALRVVAVDGDTVLGWAAASFTSRRVVYAGVVEDSVYVSRAARGRGVGGALLAALIETAEREGIWTIQSSIFPENTVSLHLHQRYGFREVGRRERIALMTYGPLAGTWCDTVLIERRSAGNPER